MIPEMWSIVKTFTFVSKDCVKVSSPVTIPVNAYFSIRELGYQLISENSISFHEEEALMLSLQRFIEEETEAFEIETFAKIQSKVFDANEKSKCVQKMNSLINAANVCSQTPTEKKGSDNKFGEMYHELVHSGFLTESIISLEHCYSIAVSELIKARNNAIEKLTDYQSKEMEEVLKFVGITSTDEDVNRMSVRHFREVEELQSQWDKDILEMKSSQKSKFHDLIKKAYIYYCSGERESIISWFRSKEELTLSECGKNLDFLQEWETLELHEASSMEESFTINLGSQLKTTHNLRLTCKNVLDLFSDHNRFLVKPSPQRIQTAMSLYTNCLSGVILLVDNRVNSYSGIKKEFAKICSLSTDFHFLPFEEQQSNIRELKLNMDSHKSQSKHIGHPLLKPGDFYITKHSNLTQVHVVFHLVCDDTVSSSELNSRHPVILGLRNILKLAHINDIIMLSLPLLLIHEMTENITLQWCLKRAELVLKCVKGFMIEMASLSPTTEDNKTLQFIVPKGISEELFSNLASMLSGIFHQINALHL